MISKKFPFLEICATLCNATFQFSRKQKFPFLEICVTSRDNHGIESNRIRIESESFKFDSFESESFKFDSFEFESFKFYLCGILVTAKEDNVSVTIMCFSVGCQ